MKKILSIASILSLTACVSPEMTAKIAERNAAFAALRVPMLNAQRAAGELTCTKKDQCDRMFRVASDFVTEMSSMKIQIASPNYISTYNPINVGHIGMSARRTLVSGDTELIKLEVNCRGIDSGHEPFQLDCFKQVENAYRVYKAKIDLVNVKGA